MNLYFPSFLLKLIMYVTNIVLRVITAILLFYIFNKLCYMVDMCAIFFCVWLCLCGSFLTESRYILKTGLLMICIGSFAFQFKDLRSIIPHCSAEILWLLFLSKWLWTIDNSRFFLCLVQSMLVFFNPIKFGITFTFGNLLALGRFVSPTIWR